MYTLLEGNCVNLLPTIETASVDCIITDPPYPCIDRPYGRMTEAEWDAMMRVVVPECRRVLKPTGSAVFILQPNSERVGRMRPWLWEFMAWTAREWGQIQDAWWWNTATLPSGVSTPRSRGLLRASLKACVWLGESTCYRDQEAVLWLESQANAARRAERRCGRVEFPSGQGVNAANCSSAAIERGGVTPFNVLPVANTDSSGSAGAHGHGAGTPLALADWWTRYICPPGGTVLDCFAGTSTMGVAALQNGCSFVGIEQMPEYVAVSRARLEAAAVQPRLEGVA